MVPTQQLSRKRPATESGDNTDPDDWKESPLRRVRRDVLKCELETLQAELEHERSLRALDAKQFVHSKHRFEKQLQFALEETAEAKELMKEMQLEHENHVEQLKRARVRAQEELRQVQREMGEKRALAASKASDEDPSVTALQRDIVARSVENQQLRETIADLRDELKRYMERRVSSSSTELAAGVPNQALSEARPEVLRELSRVRVLLAESERKNRQYKRAVDEAAQKSKELIHEQERLRAANKRIEYLEGELREQTKSEESALAELRDLKKKHESVLEKFGKLREAVYTERSKAEEAAQRADQAEALAGKGSFDPEKTQVLHLSNNPLTEVLKEEVSVLRRQVEALSGKGKKKPQGMDIDPEKLHQRLKESFKEQIGRFREGVYLMTGFKVEMIPGPDNERYKFKVRSVFAERERDHLIFQWPEGTDVTSLDLLDTQHAKELTSGPSGQYLIKLHSLPAFMASVQLSLFEKQTMM